MMSITRGVQHHQEKERTPVTFSGLCSVCGSVPSQCNPLQGCQALSPRNSMSGSRKTRGEGEMQIKIERNVDCIVTASIKLRHFSLMSQQQ